MKRLAFSFDGCGWYEYEDAYQFTVKFEEWWEKELRKRMGSDAAFIKRHGKGWWLAFTFQARKGTKKVRCLGPDIQRNCVSDPPHHRNWCVELPSFRFKSPNAKAYVPLMRQLLEQFALVLERERIDASRIRKDSEPLLKRFASQTGMLIRESDPDEDPGLYSVPYNPSQYRPRAKKKIRKRKLPAWKIPKNLQRRVEEDGEWETERFAPLRILVTPGAKSRARKFPLDWQIELEIDRNDRQYASAAEKIKAMGNEPDGYGWVELIEREFSQRSPKLARELDSDPETSTCVVSVGSEVACRKLVGLVWSIIYPK
jgi:hypothetical protein